MRRIIIIGSLYLRESLGGDEDLLLLFFEAEELTCGKEQRWRGRDAISCVHIFHCCHCCCSTLIIMSLIADNYLLLPLSFISCSEHSQAHTELHTGLADITQTEVLTFRPCKVSYSASRSQTSSGSLISSSQVHTQLERQRETTQKVRAKKKKNQNSACYLLYVTPMQSQLHQSVTIPRIKLTDKHAERDNYCCNAGS